MTVSKTELQALQDAYLNNDPARRDILCHRFIKKIDTELRKCAANGNNSLILDGLDVWYRLMLMSWEWLTELEKAYILQTYMYSGLRYVRNQTSLRERRLSDYELPLMVDRLEW